MVKFDQCGSRGHQSENKLQLIGVSGEAAGGGNAGGRKEGRKKRKKATLAGMAAGSKAMHAKQEGHKTRSGNEISHR